MKLCLFCGAAAGESPRYAAAVSELVREIAQCGHQIVYGGASVGLMGVVADVAISLDVPICGVITEELDKQNGHDALTRKFVVKSIAERKQRYFEISDAFIALPGGFGTLDEIADHLALYKLGLSNKPVGFFDVAGYFDRLLSFFRYSVAEGFNGAVEFDRIVVSGDPRVLISSLQNAVGGLSRSAR